MKKRIFIFLMFALTALTLCSCFSSTNLMVSELNNEVNNQQNDVYTEPEPVKVYFENFAMTVSGGTYDAPVSVSFEGTENGRVFYAFSDNLFDGSDIMGMALTEESITLPAGTFKLKAVCVDKDGNRSNVISDVFTVNRTFANLDLGDVVECEYFDFVVVRDTKDKIYCYNKFTGALGEIKKYIGDISHIVAETKITNNREINPELYDKIVGVASADAAASIAGDIVEDTLYVYTTHNGIHDDTSYIYRNGELKVDDEETMFTYSAGKYEPRFPENMPEIVYEDEKMVVKSFVGDYYFCSNLDGDAHYVYNSVTGEFVEDKLLSANRYHELAGVTSNAAYYRVIEDGHNICKRVSYSEIEDMFSEK